MRAGKCREISRLVNSKNPQLARRHDQFHATCTIPRIGCFFKLLFYKENIRLQDLAQCLQ